MEEMLANVTAPRTGAPFRSGPGMSGQEASCMPSLLNGCAGMQRCVCVAMAAYNEQDTVREIASCVLGQPVVQELIIVDDGSTDRTWERLREVRDQRVRVFRLERNRGKGAALRVAIAHARAPVVIIQDADLEYDPMDYPVLISPILAGKADVVFGSRFAGGGAHCALYFWHAVGNKFLTLLSNMLTNLNLTDMECCYKAFRTEVLRGVVLRENRFGFEPEVTARISQIKGIRVYEVPVSYYGRSYAEGKKVSWRDGVSALRCVLKYNVTSGRGSRAAGGLRIQREIQPVDRSFGTGPPSDD